MFSITRYMEDLIQRLKEQFGPRLLYVGLQGSFRRGEADKNSDIDAMVILDRLSEEDLNQYRTILRSLEAYDRSCGFICGKEELKHWNACEICQLFHETQDFYGTLQPLLPSYTDDDVKMHVKISAGNVYHALCHRFLHASREENYRSLPQDYKAVFYILQNRYYLKTGRFILTKRELLSLLDGDDRTVLETAIALRAGKPYEFEKAFSLLFRWCQALLQTDF